MEYVEIARQRIAAIMPTEYNQEVFDVRDKRRLAERVPFARLLENGLLQAGQSLYFRQDRALSAHIKADGKLIMDGFEGSIHQAGSRLMAGSPCNGWEHWYYEGEDGELHPIDGLRQIMNEPFNRLILTGKDDPNHEPG